MEENWLKSKEALAILKGKDCQLMHLRVAGKVVYKKVGNSFYYNQSDIIKIRAEKESSYESKTTL